MNSASRPVSLASQLLSKCKSIFQDAIDLPESEREAYLDRFCAGDPQLRSEVERLIHLDRSAGNFLEADLPPEIMRVFTDGQKVAGRFRITKFLGRGGMGEVYEAMDEVLGEPIAIKTIRPEIAGDRRLTARLRRELNLSRKVSHPNVCRVFELWEQQEDDSTRLTFLTMELLNGETLAERLHQDKSERLSYSKVLPLVRQIVAGLSQVHQLGIVHRDLKPSNLYLVPEHGGGTRVVVMDFGLARSSAPDAFSLSGTGDLLGTPAYMSPEQFNGQEVTVASDIYSVGVTIFEMITGQCHPLVPPSTLVPDLPREWNETILRCLENDPRRRPSSATEVLELLERSKPVAFPRRFRKPALGVTLASLAALMALWVLWPKANPGVALLSQLTFDGGITECPSVSADGKLLAYASDRVAGDYNIWIQNLRDGSRRQLTFDPGHEVEPAISPDGAWVAYRSETSDGIYVVSQSGGPARLAAGHGHNPRFSPDGKLILYWTGQLADLWIPSGQIGIVPAAGGAPTRLAASFADARFPTWSGDGKRILFRGSVDSSPQFADSAEWWTIRPDGGSLQPTGVAELLRKSKLSFDDGPVSWDGGKFVFPARSGHSRNLWTISLPSSSGRAQGFPQRLTTETEINQQPWISGNRDVLYSAYRGTASLWRASLADGRTEQLTSGESIDARASVSADDGLVIFGRRLGEVRNVFSLDLATRADRPLVQDEAAMPLVSPDRSAMAYSVRAGKRNQILLQRLDGSAPREVCADCGDLLAWVPDGSGVLFLAGSAPQNYFISRLDLGTGERRPVLQNGAFDQASISPDGARIAFTLRNSGMHARIYAARLHHGSPVPSSEWRTVTDGKIWDDKPHWSPDGRAIIFESDRDGFRCFWKQDLGPDGLAPSGEPRSLVHLHKANPSQLNLSRSTMSLAVGDKWIYYALASAIGNLWSIRQP